MAKASKKASAPKTQRHDKKAEKTSQEKITRLPWDDTCDCVLELKERFLILCRLLDQPRIDADDWELTLTPGRPDDPILEQEPLDIAGRWELAKKNYSFLQARALEASYETRGLIKDRRLDLTEQSAVIVALALELGGPTFWTQPQSHRAAIRALHRRVVCARRALRTPLSLAAGKLRLMLDGPELERRSVKSMFGRGLVKDWNDEMLQDLHVGTKEYVTAGRFNELDSVDCWHGGGMSQPDEFKFGPLTGCKKDLCRWIIPNAKPDRRTLSNRMDGNQFWGRQDTTTSCSVYFRDEKKYAESNQRKLADLATRR